MYPITNTRRPTWPSEARTWYTWDMNPIPGTGPTLRDASPYLRDDAECISRILNVSERNSMIEGLPAFDETLRHSIRRELEAIFSGSAHAPRRSA